MVVHTISLYKFGIVSILSLFMSGLVCVWGGVRVISLMIRLCVLMSGCMCVVFAVVDPHIVIE